jgi:hypothetical protein
MLRTLLALTFFVACGPIQQKSLVGAAGSPHRDVAQQRDPKPAQAPAVVSSRPTSKPPKAPKEDFFAYHERRMAELALIAEAGDFGGVERELRTLIAEAEAQTPVALEAVNDRTALAWLRWKNKDYTGALTEMGACALNHHNSGMMGNMSVFTGNWEAWLEAFFLRELAAFQTGAAATATLSRAEKARAAHESDARNIGRQLDAAMLKLHFAVRRSARSEVSKRLSDPALLSNEDEEPEHLYVVAQAFELVRDHARYLDRRSRLEKTQGSIIKAILLAELPP